MTIRSETSESQAHLTNIFSVEEGRRYANEDERTDVLVELYNGKVGDCCRGKRREKYADALELTKVVARIQPPAILKVNPTVWRRFVSRVQTARMGFQSSQMTFPALFPFMAFLLCFLQVGDEDEQPPLWVLVGLPIATVQMIFSLVLLKRRFDDKSLSWEHKAVTKMKQTFLRAGYEVAYIPENARETYVRFRPVPLVPGTRVESDSTIDEGLPNPTSSLPGSDYETTHEGTSSDAYQPESWAPLEGYWKLSTKNASAEEDEKLRQTGFLCCIHFPETEIEISGTQVETTFSLRLTTTVRCCLSLNKDRYKTGHAEGNTLLYDFDVATERQLNRIATAAQDHEALVAALSEVKADAIRDLTFRSIGVGSDGSTAYFRNDSGSEVWKVDENSMVVFQDLEDDHLADDDILDGLLDRNPPEDLKLAAYEKLDQNQVLERKRASQAAMSAFAEEMRQAIGFAFACQFTAGLCFVMVAIIIAEGDVLVQVAMIITGLVTEINAFYLLLLPYQYNKVPERALVSSILQMLCLFVLYSIIGIRHPKVYTVAFALVCLSFAWLCGAASFYVCVIWRREMQRHMEPQRSPTSAEFPAEPSLSARNTV